ncbi:diguanylate cyclase [Halomonas sp. ZH2S]|uniref:diguanylate cyclase n=1 Tax=Vreelandella zhuhanensis TaxID=2684210 RepID=A0A7X3GZ52_9GAMM|nr:diguanylate cyclase [Halomonas zhuhanensis]MWJ27424.1 diguanylate cyclase [Halomonas zhuhanensis]
MPEQNDPSDLESRLTSLRAAYRQRLVKDLAEIESVVRRLRPGADNSEALGFLHHALHKLAGSAGTFGFDQLGRQARQQEQEIEHWKQRLSGSVGAFEVTQLGHWLGRLNASLRADETSAGAMAVESRSEKEGDKQTIWLVERDQMLADYMAQQLRSFGFVVRHYLNVEQIEGIDDEQPDLLLVDHRASNNGDALRQEPVTFWQERLARYLCPIIFTAGEENYISRLTAVRSGAEGYFVKPIDVPQLAAHVAQLLKSGDQSSERVLIVEGDQALAESCVAVLAQAGMQARCIHDPQCLIQIASEFSPELILMDLQLPGATGAELGMMLRQFERWQHLSIIYLSSASCQYQREEALMRGGDAFLEKPVDARLLVNTCRARVQRVRKLEEAMVRDGLTGLLKHASIKEALAEEWRSAQRSGNPFSVVMLDIDHFKSVNDTHGHAVGDLVISAVGTLLRQHFRSTDRLGRYGGEEFALVLPNCEVDVAAKLVDGLRDSFAAIQFVGGNDFSCTLSAGVVDNQQLPEGHAGELLEAADNALYQAKNAGRNRVCIAQPTSA